MKCSARGIKVETNASDLTCIRPYALFLYQSYSLQSESGSGVRVNVLSSRRCKNYGVQ